MHASNVRPPAVAGSWYPGHPEKLIIQVDTFLEAASSPTISGEVVGLVVPHAGFRYSGLTAGYGFRCLRGLTPEIVVVISPFHDSPSAGVFSSGYAYYQTPLGQIPVDRQSVEALENKIDLAFVNRESEHAIEIELPFLQRVLDVDFKLLPVMIASSDPAVIYKLGEALATVLREQAVLLVASSDLSHFKSLAIAKELDMEMLKQMEAFSPEGLLAAQHAGRGYACGLMAIVAVMVAARILGADTSQVIHYSTSADVSGDESSVVGYGSVVFSRSKVK